MIVGTRIVFSADSALVNCLGGIYYYDKMIYHFNPNKLGMTDFILVHYSENVQLACLTCIMIIDDKSRIRAVHLIGSLTYDARESTLSLQVKLST